MPQQKRSSSSSASQKSKRSKSNSESAAAASMQAVDKTPKSRMEVLLKATSLLERVERLESAKDELDSKRAALIRDMESFKLKASTVIKLKSELQDKELLNADLKKQILKLKKQIVSKDKSNADLTRSKELECREKEKFYAMFESAARERGDLIDISTKKISDLQAELDSKTTLNTELLNRESEQKLQLSDAALQIDILTHAVSVFESNLADEMKKNQDRNQTITELQNKLLESGNIIKMLREQINGASTVFSNTHELMKQRLAIAEKTIEKWSVYKNYSDQEHSALSQEINCLHQRIREKDAIIALLQSVRPDSGLRMTTPAPVGFSTYFSSPSLGQEFDCISGPAASNTELSQVPLIQRGFVPKACNNS